MQDKEIYNMRSLLTVLLTNSSCLVARGYYLIKKAASANNLITKDFKNY